MEISNVSSDGSFTKGITNLKHSTKYYYIVYAFIEDVDFYGDVKYLTTESFDVTLETGNTDDLKEFSASLGGVFTVNSSYNLETYVAMYLSESDVSGSDFKSKGTTYEVKSVSFDGTFEVNIGNLQQGKTYYYAAYAKVNNVEYWGGTKSFTTPTIKVSLSCEVSDYGEYWVTVSGAFSLESIETIASRVLFYYAKDADTISDLKKNSTPIEIPAEDYSFEKMITGLQSSTSYSFALCAIVLGEEYWSDVAQCVTVKVPTGYEALGLNVYWAKNNSNCGYLSWESASGYTQLPSRSDWYELIHNCSWVWDSSNYGFTIISNVKGYEGKSIFLPAGGYRDSSSGTLYYNNVECLYWTSYERDSECAYYMRATSSVSPNTNFYNNKAIRFPVRGVCAKE